MVQELRRGTIILGVLSQLDSPMYGYNLVTVLSENNIPVEANTLYPLLRRLESQEILQSTWETSGAKPRKYYSLTENGKGIYSQLKKTWTELSNSLNTLIGENIMEVK